MPRDKIEYTIKSILEGVVKQAERDGIITNEEAELINKIQVSARELEERLVRILKEERPSKEELNRIIDREKLNLIRDATEHAKKDGVITQDEQEIIDRLIKEFEKVYLINK